MLRTSATARATGRRTAPSHHLDHPELLLLDNAVARLTERYIVARSLTSMQRAALEAYRGDVDVLIPGLAGPARDYASHLADLADVVLRADADAQRAGRRKAARARSAA